MSQNLASVSHVECQHFASAVCNNIGRICAKFALFYILFLNLCLIVVLSFHDRCLWPQIYSKEPTTTAIVNFIINMHCMDNTLVGNQRTIKRSEFNYAYSFEHKVSFKLLYVKKRCIIPTLTQTF